MTKISGFSIIHNANQGGYPLRETIESLRPYVHDIWIVDMESTDGTREFLESQDVNIIDGKWGNQAGETLKEAYALHTKCSGDVIIFAEADEVYDESLLLAIEKHIYNGHQNLSVYRLQLEQNFQRCRWYPELVHRVFPKGSTIKDGHTTEQHDKAMPVSQEFGFLWDITNSFRDNWIKRIKKQAELRQEDLNYLYVPLHVIGQNFISENQIEFFLTQEHWTWTKSPFDLPEILKPLVGQTEYTL